MVEVIIEGTKVPYLGEVPITLTKVNFDVEQLQKRSTNYSKTVNVPSTSSTDELFSRVFKINNQIRNTSTANFNPDFNPNLRADCTISNNGVPLIQGYCQLQNIVKLNGKYTYQLKINDDQSRLFKDAYDKNLQDLDFSDLDHTYNVANIEASWNATQGEGYYYPMIDYGTKFSYDNWFDTDFTPAIYVKEYVDRIFEQRGYTYTSDFFATDYFKSLILLAPSEKAYKTDDDIYDEQFIVSRETSSQTITNPQGTSYASVTKVIFNDESTSPNHDTANNEYNNSTGVYVSAGRNKVTFKGSISITITNNTGSAHVYLPNTDGYIEFQLIRLRDAVYGPIEVLESSIFQYPTTFSNGNSITSIECNFTTNEWETRAGDEYFLFPRTILKRNLTSLYQWVDDTTAYDIVINTGSIYGTTVNKTILSGDTLSLNNFVPDYKQSEFLADLVKLFNLYIEPTQIDPKCLKIEPRDSFYTSTVKIATDNLDKSKDETIIPMGALTGKNYIFEYAEDKDLLNDTYQDTWEESYGAYDLVINNDFVQGEERVKVKMAATPLKSYETNDRILSSIELKGSDNQNTKAGKPRILFANYIDSDVTWSLDDTVNQTSAPQNQFPYAGHLDDPYDPTYDINWFIPRTIYYDFSFGGNTDIPYTNANLFNTYWYRTIQEIINRDSKIYECYMRLTAKDWYDFTFDKLYWIEDAYFRLLEIKDYNVEGTDTVLCKFIKIDASGATLTGQANVFGGEGSFTNGDRKPQGGERIGTGSDQGDKKTINQGEGTIGGRQGFAASDDVVMGRNVEKYLIVNSDGQEVVQSGVTLINSPGVATIRKDSAYINNLFTTKGVTFDLDGQAIIDSFTTPLSILPDLGANEYYVITKCYYSFTENSAFGGVGDLYIQTNSTGSTLATIGSTAFSGTNKDLADSLAEVLDFGEGLEITTSAEFSGGTNNELTIYVEYRIIEIE